MAPQPGSANTFSEGGGMLQPMPPAFNDPFSLGLAKPPAHVQDRIKQIKKANPNAGASLKGSKFGENLSY